MGTEIAKTAKSAIECPNNLIPTFFDHGLGYPLNVRVLALAVINGSFFVRLQKPAGSDELLNGAPKYQLACQTASDDEADANVPEFVPWCAATHTALR